MRGDNEPCVLYHKGRDLTVLVYVDDILCDGLEEDIKWFFDKLGDRFDCKDDEWLSPENSLDFLGLDVSMDGENIYVSMEPYVNKTLKAMGMEDTYTVKTPIDREIVDNTPLPSHLRQLFMTGVGCVGWLTNTVRCDASLAHSRIAQHMANPTTGAWKALQHVMRYFKGTSGACLWQPLHGQATASWRFYTDSDHASNPFPENKRRSQNGFVALHGMAPVAWGSKVSSVCFAHPDIGEAHADMSSGAAEVYAAGNATFDMIHLSYVVDEMGNIPFDMPMCLEMDNTTAECFANESAFKSKLKHIDCRQQWVRVLRDKDIIVPKHVHTKSNLADLFTKVLASSDFYPLATQLLMFNRPGLV